MRHVILGILTVLLSVSGMSLEGRLFYNPDLKGDQIVFTFEDDLWLGSTNDVPARRLTSHPGAEINAHFSPDGKWIAFTGNYDGGRDVYVIPSQGGEPYRLTFHPASDYVQGFTPDGRHVLFTSRRGWNTGLYRVPVRGGFPELYPLDMVRYASMSPDGSKIAYNRFNSDRMNWKGYKGGRQQDIWVADLNKGTFTRMTNWDGYDNRPMWSGNKIFFNSDREDGRMNLYSLDISSGDTRRLTHFVDWDVEMPSMDESSGRIIFVSGGYLKLVDPSSGTVQELSMTIPTERWQTRDFQVEPASYLHSLAPDREGNKIVCESRGDIFLIDNDLEEAVNLTSSPGSRELEPVLSPDGETLAFFSDMSGEYELYLGDPEPGSTWKQLSYNSNTFYYHIRWSPDSKKVLFGDKNYSIYFLDIEEGNVVTIDDGRYLKDNEIFWEVSEYHWSPDSRYVVYSLPLANLNNAIYLYDTKTGKKDCLTNGHYDDYSPVFDKNGRHLYFLSRRNFEPILDPFMDNNLNADMSVVMMIQLQKGEPVPFTKRWEQFLEDQEKKDEVEVTIDLQDLDRRIFRTPIPAGTYKDLEGGELTVWYLSKKRFGFPGIEEFFHPKSVRDYTLHHYDLKEEKDTVILEGIGSYLLSYDQAKLTYMAGDRAGMVDSKTAGKAGDGTLKWNGLSYTVDTSEEYRQIFRDVWRQIRDYFYDPAIHGKDWNAIFEKYSPLVPYVSTRNDLNYILGHMLGELTASHEYIIDQGGPERLSYDRVQVGLLGADIILDRDTNHYRISRILQGRSDVSVFQSPLLAPDVDIREGSYILKIDGQEVTGDTNFYSHFEGKAGREIDLTVNTEPTYRDARTFRVKTVGYDYMLRYYDWVQGNIEKVKERTADRVGYFHLADMDSTGLSQFEEGFRALRYKDGLIIDVRFNGGGFVSPFMIDKLERHLQYLTVTRDFAPMYYPHGVKRGPIVVICNGGTGSDGEIFSQHFKDLRLGTVVGTRTWGGLIGIINMVPLIDGGMVTQSNVGFANLMGSWVVENRGAEPDIVIENPPGAIVKGDDLQLDFAIDLVMKQIEETPPSKLIPPPFPVK